MRGERIHRCRGKAEVVFQGDQVGQRADSRRPGMEGYSHPTPSGRDAFRPLESGHERNSGEVRADSEVRVADLPPQRRSQMLGLRSGAHLQMLELARKQESNNMR